MFGIFGHGNVCGMGQALEECGQDLPYYQPCNEQSMVHTALGFAKANRRLATLACTASIGPGSTNMITGAAAATINRLPVLLLPSDYYATRHQGPVLQQLEHPVSADVSVNDCFRPVSRFFDRITRPEQILTALPEAMRVLTDPAETGAVTIALPQDVQAHAYDYPAHFFRERRLARRAPAARSRADSRGGRAARRSPAAGDPRRRRRALLGSVAPSSRSSPRRSASPWARPSPARGRCATPRRWPWAASAWRGRAPGHDRRAGRPGDLRRHAVDRLHHRLAVVLPAPGVRFVSINVCGHDAYKQGALPILADAREALRALHQAAAAAGLRPRPAYRDEVAAARRAWDEKMQSEVYTHHEGEAMSQGELIGALNQEAQPGDTVIAAAGGTAGRPAQALGRDRRPGLPHRVRLLLHGLRDPGRPGRPAGPARGRGLRPRRRRHLPDEPDRAGHRGAGGPEDHRRPRREPRVPVHPPAPDVADRRQLRQRVPPPRPGTNRLEGEYLPIDLARNAESFGARTWHVETPEQLRQALREARAERRTCVIVAEVEKHRFLPGGGTWWDVAPAEVSQDARDTRRSCSDERYRDGIDRSRLTDEASITERVPVSRWIDRT